SGHAPTNERGLGAFQEMAQADIARPLTKASGTAQNAAGLGDDMRRAFAPAQESRPGPAHLRLPAHLLEAGVSATASPSAAPTEPTKPDDALVGRIAARLEKAARPVIVCGPAMSNGDGPARVERLREASGLPVIVMESPRGLNDPGQ